jgi:hypothetical protein
MTNLRICSFGSRSRRSIGFAEKGRSLEIEDYAISSKDQPSQFLQILPRVTNVAAAVVSTFSL